MQMKPLNEKLNELEKIARAATQGRWVLNGDGQSCDEDGAYASSWVETPNGTWSNSQGCYTGTEMCEQMADAGHIATFSPETALSLIEAVRARDRAIELMRDAIQKHIRTGGECFYLKGALDQVEEILNG